MMQNPKKIIDSQGKELSSNGILTWSSITSLFEEAGLSAQLLDLKNDASDASYRDTGVSIAVRLNFRNYPTSIAEFMAMESDALLVAELTIESVDSPSHGNGYFESRSTGEITVDTGIHLQVVATGQISYLACISSTCNSAAAAQLLLAILGVLARTSVLFSLLYIILRWLAFSCRCQTALLRRQNSGLFERELPQLDFDKKSSARPFSTLVPAETGLSRKTSAGEHVSMRQQPEVLPAYAQRNLNYDMRQAIGGRKRQDFGVEENFALQHRPLEAKHFPQAPVQMRTEFSTRQSTNLSSMLTSHVSADSVTREGLGAFKRHSRMSTRGEDRLSQSDPQYVKAKDFERKFQLLETRLEERIDRIEKIVHRMKILDSPGRKN